MNLKGYTLIYYIYIYIILSLSLSLLNPVAQDLFEFVYPKKDRNEEEWEGERFSLFLSLSLSQQVCVPEIPIRYTTS